MSKFSGSLNSRKGGYFGRGHTAFMKCVRIVSLQRHNPLNAPLYKDGFWNYTKKVNIFRCDNKVYATDRDWNAGRSSRNKIIGFPRYKK